MKETAQISQQITTTQGHMLLLIMTLPHFRTAKVGRSCGQPGGTPGGRGRPFGSPVPPRPSFSRGAGV